MNLKNKFLFPGCYGVIIVCFFFPFLDVKCNDVELAKISGIELATGTKLNVDQKFPSLSKDETNQIDFNAETQTTDRNYFAIAALLLAIGGLVLSLLLREQKEMVISMIGLGGVLALLLMRIQIDNSIAKETDGASKYVVHIDYVYGYWISIVLFATAGVTSMNEFIRKRNASVE